MNNIDPQYLSLCQDILDNGTKKQTRTGTDSISIFGRQIRHKMSDGFPLLTTKKMAWKTIVTELLWFLRGDTNIKFLHDNNCHIWDGDYEKSGRTDGELGPIYGKQWRQWQGWLVKDGKAVGSLWYDQIARLVHSLKTEPDSRRLMVSAWNVGELDQMVLPPCHYGFQVYTRELSIKERFELWNKIPTRDVMDFPIGYLTEEQYHEVLDKIGVQRRAISLMWNQRSVDVPLGLPFNIASYGLLLHILAEATNMIPDELIGNLGDCHIYENQIDGIKEQLTREPFKLPELFVNSEFWNHEYSTISRYINSMEIGDFQIENYQSHPSIKMPLSN
jgi:thymidylate synthase